MSRRDTGQPYSDPHVILAHHRVIRLEHEAAQDHDVGLARAAVELEQAPARRGILRNTWRYWTTVQGRIVRAIRQTRRRTKAPAGPIMTGPAAQAPRAEVDR